ncbi:MAG: hypothetical protein M1814_003616 [Vezdaea aestivalis]|nr:MAG: hypothetical protein M1814_003616 [Vezdaea aestivalis]
MQMEEQRHPGPRDSGTIRTGMAPNDAVAAPPATRKRRPAEEGLEAEQPLAKRLSLLTIGRNGGLFVPQRKSRRQRCSTGPAPAVSEDPMRLDDTKDRVYIHNIEDELSDSESEREQLIFLPDIERKLSEIPKSVLVDPASSAESGKELILYNVPLSLSVPEHRDSARKAILEARARAQHEVGRTSLFSSNESERIGIPRVLDVDAMEID